MWVCTQCKRGTLNTARIDKQLQEVVLLLFFFQFP